MIFRRSLVRELTATAIALFVVLLGILFTQSVIRILARAAGGAVATEGILALIGFNAMFYLNLLLSVALFLTVLLTLSRWYRDSEMVVWFTSGQSLTACLKPILLFAAPFLVAIILLSLFLSPWGPSSAGWNTSASSSRARRSRSFRPVSSANSSVRASSCTSRASTRWMAAFATFSCIPSTTSRMRPPSPGWDIWSRKPMATALSCWRTAGATKESRGRPIFA